MVISNLFSVEEWGAEESRELKSINLEALSELEDYDGGLFFKDVDKAEFEDEKFVLIGTTYADSLYINLNTGKNYGCIYNSISLSDGFAVFKVADNFIELFSKIESSLKKNVS